MVQYERNPEKVKFLRWLYPLMKIVSLKTAKGGQANAGLLVLNRLFPEKRNVLRT